MQPRVVSGHRDSKARPVPGIWDIRGRRSHIVAFERTVPLQLEAQHDSIDKACRRSHTFV